MHCNTLPAALAVLLASSVLLPPPLTAQRTIPPAVYFDVRDAYDDGDFEGALRGMRAVLAGNLSGRLPLSMICYHALAGECLYQLGDLPGAMDQYTASLRAWQSTANWMLHCSFPAEQLVPDESVPRPVVTWTGRARRGLRARIPDHFSINVGGLANFLRNPGTGELALAPQTVQVRVEGLEILRCTALALRRRAELLGPLAPHDPMTDAIVAAFAAPLAPPNHYSGSWVRLLRGLAQLAAGRPREASLELQASLTIGNLDHPLTCVALLELGKLAQSEGALEQAQQLFLEATFSAAEHLQVDVVAEAFRHGTLVHLQRGERAVWPPLAASVPWSRRLSRTMSLSLAASLSENLAAAGSSNEAVAMLDRARRDAGRRSMGVIGARLLYQAALARYQTGSGPAADQSLANAMPLLIKASRWNYQTSLADQLHGRGALPGRAAAALFDHLLRDPDAADWLRDPSEALAALLAPNEAAMQHWFELAVDRKEWERALEISDLIRRRRFYRSLPLGGRLLALRWIAEAPDSQLADSALRERQHLRNTRPAYAQLSQQAAALRTQLKELPLQIDDDARRKQQAQLFEQFDQISRRQELMLRAFALDRVPSELVFPPRFKTTELQQQLTGKQAVLSYFATAKHVYALAVTRDGVSAWIVAEPQAIRADLAALLKAIGCIKGNFKVPPALLANTQWQELAKKLRGELFPTDPARRSESGEVTPWEEVEQLVIVPDGPLWYLPFELLPHGDGDGDGDDSPMIDRKEIRYAPLISLAWPPPSPRPRDVRTAIVAQRVLPEDTVEQAKAEAQRLAAARGGAAIWDATMPASSALLSAVSDQMIVWSNLPDTPNSAPYAWAPMLLDQGRPGSTLASWLELPFGGPREIALPGFHTSAEAALSRSNADGSELFLAACGLMADGTRTAILSRWPVGGQSTRELIREAMLEMDHSTPAQAWQRAVQLLRVKELDPRQEPRLAEASEFVSGGHPLFWSGYLLIDSSAAPSTDK